MIGKLIVRVYKAEGLASADMNGKSDPFIKMKLVNQIHRTSTQYRTLNPVWNEMFHFDVLDIHNQLDFIFYDEDRHGEDFLGRIVIPLLSIKNKKMIWYRLKDKKLQNSAKGRVLLRLDIEWSLVKACIRTFNPLEELRDPPAPVIKRSLMVSNFIRAKTQIMILVDVLKYIKSCFQWENKIRSLSAFALFLLVTLCFEVWMLPMFLLGIFCFNYCVVSSKRVRRLLGFDEARYSKLADVTSMMLKDESVDDHQNQIAATTKEINNNITTSSNQCNGIYSTIRAGCSFTGKTCSNSNLSINSHQSYTSNQTVSSSQDSNDNRSLVERIQAGKDVVILVQDITGDVASYLERISNTFTFKVPFLSYLMMFCLGVATVLLYFVPLRYIVLAWGINKFTKKIRNPNAIDNNELMDFLSRVPDNTQCLKQQNVICY